MRYDHVIILRASVAALSSGTGLGCITSLSEEVAIENRLGTELEITSRSVETAKADHQEISRVLVDVTFEQTRKPFLLNFGLSKVESTWHGTLPTLPARIDMWFHARALNADGTVIFAGDTIAALTLDNQAVEISLSPTQDGSIWHSPRLLDITYPADIISGQQVPVTFRLAGNSARHVRYELTSQDGSSPFTPATGTVSIGSDPATDLVVLYTAPQVREAIRYSHRITLAVADDQNTTSVSMGFMTRVVPAP